MVLSNTNLTAYVSFDVDAHTRDIDLYSGIELEITLPNTMINTSQLAFPHDRKFNVSLASAQFGQHGFKLLLMFNETVSASASITENRGEFLHVP